MLAAPPDADLSSETSRQAATLERDEQRAVEDLVRQLRPASPSTTFVFAAPHYDLGILARSLRSSVSGEVHGCTTAGLIGCRGLQQVGMTAVTLFGPKLRLKPFVISPLREYITRAVEIGRDVRARLADCPSGWTAAGLLLIDGLSGMEERVASALYHSLPHIPLVGGSAADDLEFQATGVYVEGQFLSDAAVFVLLTTALPLYSMRAQHYEPTSAKLVVTEADPKRRIVYELNGAPAAAAYGQRIGVRPNELHATDFSQAPLMLGVGNEYYIRSVREVNSDLSLTLYCAVDRGLILTLGRPGDPLASLGLTFQKAREAAGDPELILGFDCVLRRLEFEQRQVDARMARLMQEHRVVGFNGYGEQFNSLHLNQTFTGLFMGAGNVQRR